MQPYVPALLESARPLSLAGARPPGDSRRLAFLVNEGAREGRTTARLQRLLDRHSSLNAAAAGVFEVASVADAAAALQALDCEVLPVAVGGDGTVNLVAQAVLNASSRRPLGVLPFGTGNAFAHSLGIGQLRHALAALASGRPRSIDIMRTSDARMPLALVSISVGFEAALLQHVARRRRLTPVLAGLFAAPGLFARHRGATLALDDVPILSAESSFYNAGVYALPCYAFGRRVFPSAKPCDGAAEACLSRSPGDYWAGFLRGRDGRLVWQRATLVTEGGIQIDGEHLTGASIEIWIESGRLDVLSTPTVGHSGASALSPCQERPDG